MKRYDPFRTFAFCILAFGLAASAAIVAVNYRPSDPASAELDRVIVEAQTQARNPSELQAELDAIVDRYGIDHMIENDARGQKLLAAGRAISNAQRTENAED